MESVFSSERLLFQDFDLEKDFEAVYAYGSDRETTRLMGWGPSTRESTREYLNLASSQAKEYPRKDYELGVKLKTTQQLIGGAGIRIGSWKNLSADIGYILNKDFWGQGYGTEVARALIDFGFDRLNLHRIWAHCGVDNTSSQRVLEKAGMKFEGRLKENLFHAGGFCDSLLFAITRGNHEG